GRDIPQADTGALRGDQALAVRGEGEPGGRARRSPAERPEAGPRGRRQRVAATVPAARLRSPGRGGARPPAAAGPPPARPRPQSPPPPPAGPGRQATNAGRGIASVDLRHIGPGGRLCARRGASQVFLVTLAIICPGATAPPGRPPWWGGHDSHRPAPRGRPGL